MIYIIQNATKALEILFRGWRDLHGPCTCPVFDLDVSVDPHEIPLALYECKICDLTVHTNLGDESITECPRCHEEALEMVNCAAMVVQGEDVWRNYE